MWGLDQEGQLAKQVAAARDPSHELLLATRCPDLAEPVNECCGRPLELRNLRREVWFSIFILFISCHAMPHYAMPLIDFDATIGRGVQYTSSLSLTFPPYILFQHPTFACSVTKSNNKHSQQQTKQGSITVQYY